MELTRREMIQAALAALPSLGLAKTAILQDAEEAANQNPTVLLHGGARSWRLNRWHKYCVET
jgi:hypothetical protein